MGRPKGSRTVLLRITYDTIGELSGGIAGNTVRQYAQRGQFNPRDLDSVLSWINARRTAKGLPLIGLPTDVGELEPAGISASMRNLPGAGAVSDDDAEAVTWETPLSPPTRTSRGLFYDPLTASYRFVT